MRERSFNTSGWPLFGSSAATPDVRNWGGFLTSTHFAATLIGMVEMPVQGALRNGARPAFQ